MDTTQVNIQSLPTELIGRIMKFVVEGPSIVHEKSALSSFKLAVVCRQWREVALSDSGLWREIFFDYSKQTGRDDDPLEMLEQYIQRAGSSMLSIIVATSRPIERQLPNLPEHDHPILRKLAGLSSRWEEAILRIRPETVTVGGAFFQLHLPNLRSLTILNDGGFALDFLPAESGLQNCPSLVYASLEGNVPPPITWTTIQTLILVWYLPSDIHTTLQLLPLSTKHLEIKNIFLYVGQAFHASEVQDLTLPGVQVLRFSQEEGLENDHVDHEMLKAIFTKVTFPSVRELSVDMQPSRRPPVFLPWPLDAFATVVGRCAASLTSLHLCHFTSSSAGIISILRQAPNLTELCLESEPHSNESASTIVEVLEGLLWDPSVHIGHWIVPLLQKLYIRFWRPRAAEVFRALFAFLASRVLQDPDRTLLSHLHISFPQTVPGEGVTKVLEQGTALFIPFVFAQWIHDHLQSFVENGLQIICNEIWL